MSGFTTVHVGSQDLKNLLSVRASSLYQLLSSSNAILNRWNSDHPPLTAFSAGVAWDTLKKTISCAVVLLLLLVEVIMNIAFLRSEFSKWNTGNSQWQVIVSEIRRRCPGDSRRKWTTGFHNLYEIKKKTSRDWHSSHHYRSSMHYP